MRVLSGLLLALVLSLPAAAQNLINLRFSQDGFDRTFHLFTPENLADFPGPRPLVLVVHGLASTDDLVRGKSRNRFHVLAAQHGFVVAYPNGIARTWDPGGGVVAELLLPRRDDLAFLQQVIAITAQRLPIDPDRIYATGFSLGGQMSLALACKHPGLIRGVMTVSMPLPEFLAEDCQAGPPLGVMLVHGTDDFWVPFDGGAFPVGPKTRDLYLSHQHSLTLFARRNRCPGDQVEIRVLDNLPDGTSVTRQFWRGCEGAPVVGFAINGGGHAWPREEQSLGRPFLGRVTQEFDAADAAWSFFQSLNE